MVNSGVPKKIVHALLRSMEAESFIQTDGRVEKRRRAQEQPGAAFAAGPHFKLL